MMEPASQPPTSTTVRNVALACLGALALVSLAAALLVAANTASAKTGTRRGEAKVGHTTITASPVAAASASATDPIGQVAVDAGTGNGDQNGSGGQATTPTDTGPRIVYFRLRQQPKCGPSGPVQPAVIEWKVSGATGAALSVDNPGIVGSYRSYPGTTGSETLTFSCPLPAGTTESHVYTIYTTGGSPQRSATMTAKATTPGASPAPKTSGKPSAPAGY
jgi:hypothetical protein